MPEGVATVRYFWKIVESADCGEEAAFFFVGLDAAEEVGERAELFFRAGLDDFF